MASLKKCIAEKCKDCTYDAHAPGTWREQVEACTVRACPLWEVRPMSVATVNLQRKAKAGDAVDIDALVDGLEDDDEPEMVAA